ncbi:MMPL family transporter [Amycolatopsis sp. H6(2020)]|nr:MMPL family transporter [Amycolatopsis sp. H6(2020)]
MAVRSGIDPGSGTRSRWWLVPALVVAGWLVAGALAGGLPGRLDEVQHNDGVAFLPAAAEATEVARVQEKLSGGPVQLAWVVFSRAGGLSAGDRAVAAGTSRSLTGLAGPVAPPVFSADGKAALVVVPVVAEDGFEAGRTVQRVRDAVAAGLPPGLAAQVTGPAGFTADLGAVFSGVDRTLLVVTALLVVAVLVAVYRSPLLPLVVLASAALALIAASSVVFPLAARGVLTLSGQGQGILFILVFGACTDYALLFIARYQEELANRDHRGALRAAFRAGESIVASAGTVVLGLCCLLLSALPSNRGLGPVAAIGIVSALVSSLTFLPAALLLLGRAAFWPSRRRSRRTRWERVARLVGARPKLVWAGTALLLAALAAFVPLLRADGVRPADVFLGPTDAVSGQEVLAAHFPGAERSPVVVIAPRERAAEVAARIRAVPGVTAVNSGAGEADGRVELDAVVNVPEAAGPGIVRDIRAAVPGVLVGGQAAIQAEIREAAERDRVVVIPAVLGVVLLVLVLLLRAVLLPLVLVATVVVSYLATLGAGALVFDEVLRLPGADPSLPLYAFVFLVTLGVDYNIFLMTRAREESFDSGPGVGTTKALTLTGPVITSAGVVLAATFAALAVLPILFMAQIAFLVAFGVLLDTLVVRSLLVPALAVHMGRFGWWPGRIGRHAG